jgi:hypothetical protein
VLANGRVIDCDEHREPAAGADGPVEVLMFGAMLGTQAETAALIGELTGQAGAQP